MHNIIISRGATKNLVTIDGHTFDFNQLAHSEERVAHRMIVDAFCADRGLTPPKEKRFKRKPRGSKKRPAQQLPA